MNQAEAALPDTLHSSLRGRPIVVAINQSITAAVARPCGQPGSAVACARSVAERPFDRGLVSC